MRTPNHFPFLLLASVVFVLVLAGCASAPRYDKPDYVAPGFDTQPAATLALLPVVDLRVDKEEALDLDAWTHRMAAGWLAKRGYKTRTYADRALVAPLQSLATRDALQAEVGKFVLADAPRHVLVIALIDARSSLTFGSTGNAEMAGYLVDQQTGTVVWRHAVVGQIGMGGLAGMLMKGLMTRSAIEEATTKLVYSFPPRDPAKP